jgi:hypothetical protein
VTSIVLVLCDWPAQARVRLPQRRVDEVDHALAGLRAGEHRGREPRVEDAPGRGLDVDRTEHAGVGQHVGGPERLDRVVAAGLERALDHVQPGQDLGRCVEAQAQVAAVDGQLEIQRDGLVDLVGVEVLVCRVGAVGDLVDDAANLALGVVEHLLRGLLEGLGAGGLHDALEARHADEVGRDLGLEVGLALRRHLEVGHQQRERLVDPRVLAADAHGRAADALLEDVVVTALDEVGVVAEVGHEAHSRALVEDGGHEHDVGQVRAAALIGVVADEHVSGGDVVSVSVSDRSDHPRQRAQVQRDVLGLVEQPALGVEDRGGAVLALLDVGRDRGAHEHHRHLVGHRAELVGDHLRGGWG